MWIMPPRRTGSSSGSGAYPSVNTYADLPDPVANAGEVYLVRNASGSWPTTKRAGLWRSDGAAWYRLGPSGAFTDLSDVSLSGNAGKAWAVNSTADGMEFAEFVAPEDLLETVILPSSFTVVAGGTETGDITDIQVALDGNTLTIPETAGGLTVDIHFTGVTAFNRFIARLMYDGGAGHVWGWGFKNWVTTNHDSVNTVVGNQASQTWFGDDVPEQTPYIGTGADAGKVTLRWEHAAPFIATHELVLDYVALVQSNAMAGATQAATQEEAETGTGTDLRMFSVLRVWQAITAWAATATSVFKGILTGYTEAATTITFTAGAATLDHATCPNNLPTTLTQNSVLTVTNLTANKPLVIPVTQSGGPWTLTLAYGAKTLAVTLNGAADQAREDVVIDCDGTDLFVPENGGVIMVAGA